MPFPLLVDVDFPISLYPVADVLEPVPLLELELLEVEFLLPKPELLAVEFLLVTPLLELELLEVEFLLLTPLLEFELLAEDVFPLNVNPPKVPLEDELPALLEDELREPLLNFPNELGDDDVLPLPELLFVLPALLLPDEPLAPEEDVLDDVVGAVVFGLALSG